jgi:hypothetical protein
VDGSELLREAEAAADGADTTTAALLAAARAWHRLREEATSVALSRAALRAARRTDNAALVAQCLDALGAATVQAGRFRRAHHIAEVRMRVVAALSAHDPTDSAEITDAFHVVASAATAAGDLPAARRAVQRARVDDPIGDHQYLSAPKLDRLKSQKSVQTWAWLVGLAWWNSMTGAVRMPSVLAPISLRAAGLPIGMKVPAWASRHILSYGRARA